MEGAVWIISKRCKEERCTHASARTLPFRYRQRLQTRTMQAHFPAGFSDSSALFFSRCAHTVDSELVTSGQRAGG